MKTTKYNTVSLQIDPKDKHRIKVLCARYDCTQLKMVKALLKLERQFKPELEDLLK